MAMKRKIFITGLILVILETMLLCGCGKKEIQDNGQSLNQEMSGDSNSGTIGEVRTNANGDIELPAVNFD